MSSRRAVALLVLATVVGLTIAPLASGAVVGAITQEESSDETEANTTVSTFMQASAADAQNAVDEGMFDAKYENADNESRAEIVTERTDELEDRLATLEAEREALREQRDEISHGQYQSRMARLTVEIAGLERAIEQTRPRAAEVGVGEKRLEMLKQNASELSGPEIAEMARGIPGHDRVPGQGPPDDRETGPGNDGKESNPENGDPATEGNDDSGGPPDHAPGSGQEDGDDGDDDTDGSGGPSENSDR